MERAASAPSATGAPEAGPVEILAALGLTKVYLTGAADLV